MPTGSEVSEFYDEYSGRTHLRDFRRLNRRHEAVRELTREFVPRGGRVLEIGCGAGILSKHLTGLGCRVLGLDISEKNVELARAYDRSGRAEFRVADIVEQPDAIASAGEFDAVVLADVIEHIPRARYAELFEIIGRVLSARGRVLLTFPSPEHQEHLKANDRDALQVIDETVRLEDLVGNTTLALRFFRYRSVWHEDDYVHAVLTADRSFSATPVRRKPHEKLAFWIRKAWWRLRNRAFLRRVR